MVHSSHLIQTNTDFSLIIEETIKKIPKINFKNKSKAEIEIFSKKIHQFNGLKLNEAEDKVKVNI